MEIKLLTEKPHSEMDILSNNPIIYKIGEILLSFDLQPMKSYTRFERGIKLFTAQSLLGLAEIPGEDNDKNDLAPLNWWEPGFGLPWFLCQFAQIINLPTAEPILKAHFAKHPKLITGIPEDFMDPIFIRFLLCDYLFYNLYTEQFIEISRELIFLQGNIKKKVMATLENPVVVPQKETVQLHPFSASRAARESLQRKRLRLARTSSSSQSPTNPPTKTNAT